MEIEKYFRKALVDYAMLQPGDRVLIGASGGKDSIALSALLSSLAARDNRYRSISIGAVHVSGGGAAPTSQQRLAYLKGLYASMGVPFEVVEIPDERPAQSCYRCSSLRRQALLNLASSEGYTKIALGHHLDDILTTALMGLVRHGTAGQMLPVRRYDDAGITLVRPLVYIPEESIRRFAAARGWEVATCSCPAGVSGERADFRQRLEVLTGGSLYAKRTLLAGLGFGAPGKVLQT